MRDHGGALAFDVEVEAWAPPFELFIPAVKRVAAAALTEEGAPAGSGVAIVLTSDASIAEYHDRFMNLPEPTDVLSWPSGMGSGDGEPIFLGDVMVSCDTARVQAEEQGHDWEREVCVLAAHGTLHLLGWDDQTDADRAAMQARVDEIVAGAIGPPGAQSVAAPTTHTEKR